MISERERSLLPDGIGSAHTTIGEALGIDDDYALGYSRAPLELTRQEGLMDATYLASMPETLLYGGRLIDLLSAVAPLQRQHPLRSKDPYDILDRYKINRGAILADWKIISGGTEEDTKLANAHAASGILKDYWGDLVRNLPPLAQAISVHSDEEIALYFEDRKRRFITTEAGVSDIRRALEETRKIPPGGRYLFWWGFNDYMIQGLDIINDDLVSSGHSPRTREGIRRAKDPEYFYKLLECLSEDAIKRLVEGVEGYGNIFRANRIVLQSPHKDPEELNRVHNPVWYSDEDRHYVEHVGDRVTIITNESTADFILDGDQITEIGRNIVSHKDDAIFPTIAWKTSKATGERRIILDPEELEGVSPLGKGNLLAGLLVALYLNPETQQSLPKSLNFRKGGKRQDMTEAQVPLLAIMHRDELQQGEALADLEAVFA